MSQIQKNNQLDAKRREDVKNYIIQDIFNINLLSLSSFGAVDVDTTVDKILDLQGLSGLGFIAFAKEQIQKIEFKSNYQRFFIVTDRFILDAKNLIDKNRPKTNFELFSEKLSKKVYTVASLLEQEINRRDYEIEEAKRIDMLKLQGLNEFEVRVVVSIGQSRASMLYRDNNRILDGLIELRDSNLLEKAIEERVEIFIISIKSKIKKADTLFFQKSARLKEKLEKKLIELEDSKETLFQKVLALLDEMKRNLIKARSEREVISFSILKKRDSYMSFFSDKELRVLDEIGLLRVLSYAQSGFLEKAILDLLKRKEREKSGRVGYVDILPMPKGRGFWIQTILA